ncbi:MAG: CYTH domain-containing protein [Rhodocyclaceae bacterium]|nr:CYTH domain-containing protein [Rhodocyclaceae bacterium]
MPKEIERKFLVAQPGILAGLEGERIVQGYVAKELYGMTTRVRIRANQAFITLKGPSVGFSRDEYEYPIPLADAEEILARYSRGRIVCKTRYLVEHDGMTYEIDVFSGRHAGLVVAELELSDENQPVNLPMWIGSEVTHDSRFGNFSLALLDSSLEAKWWIGEYGDQNDANPCCCRFSELFSCA